MAKRTTEPNLFTAPIAARLAALGWQRTPGGAWQDGRTGSELTEAEALATEHERGRWDEGGTHDDGHPAE